MDGTTDRRSQLQLAYRQLERAELYLVAARELAGADTQPGLAIEDLHQQLVLVADGLRRDRRASPLHARALRAIGE